MSLVETAPATFTWPAQRTDGSTFSSGITAIPEGTRFRLDPSFDVNSLRVPTIVKMLARAAQTYGIVVRDKAGSVALYGQDPKSLPTNPWPTAFDNQYPNYHNGYVAGGIHFPAGCQNVNGEQALQIAGSLA